MTCIDCGEDGENAITPLCAPCARLATRFFGSEQARLALLGKEQP